MRTILHGLPWALPAFAAVLLLVLVIYRPSRAVAKVPRPVLGLWIVAIGLVASATLTPGSDAPFDTAPACAIEPPDVPSVQELLRPSETSLNVALFVPLGIAAALVPRVRAAWVSFAIAAALPFLIELTQRALPVLGRGCQSADVVDNLTGLAIGAVVAVGGRAAVAAVRRKRRAPGSADSSPRTHRPQGEGSAGRGRTS